MERETRYLYQELKKYATEDYYPYHMPGHKRRMFGNMPKQTIQADITEIEGFDNLHHAEGILRELQQEAALLYGAEESFYLINGSTCGILSAISAVLPVGGHLLMARNCHKSAYHGAYLRNLTVSYLYPPVMEEYDICDAITPEQVEAALSKEPDIGAVLLVSPTYEGRIADVAKIAEIVHKRGIPLIIDEAHGAHLGWKKELGKNSCQLGADLVIHSVHKTLPAMTQTALLHVNGNLVDRARLCRFLHIYQSSSPSYILMSSIDNALKIMARDGDKLIHAFCQRFDRMMDRLVQCRCLEFLPLEQGKQDVGKLVISSQKYGLSGQRLYDILLQRYHLQVEMAAGSYCLAMFTIADSEEGYERMTHALLEIDREMQQGVIKPDISNLKRFFPMQAKAEEVLSLGTAWDMDREYVSLEQAQGRHVGEFINLYPPGIPLLVPGEILTDNLYHEILSYLEQHLTVLGIEMFDSEYMIKVLLL